METKCVVSCLKWLMNGYDFNNVVGVDVVGLSGGLAMFSAPLVVISPVLSSCNFTSCNVVDVWNNEWSLVSLYGA